VINGFLWVVICVAKLSLLLGLLWNSAILL
jgi:hypothetical protein